MTKNLFIISSALAASILSYSASAQNSPDARPGRAGEQHSGKAHATRVDRLNSAVKASDVMGMTVNNYQEEKLGKVEDLALDVESGRIVQVILSTGGFLGLGDTLTGLPPGALHHDVSKGVLHLDATQEKIKGAPKFDMTKWEESANHEQLNQMYRHYGAEPDGWFVDRDGKSAARATITDRDANTAARATSTDRDANAAARATITDRDANSNSSVARDRDRDEALNKDAVRVAGVEHSTIPASRLGQSQKASKLMGMPVNNLQNESLGKVENLLLDLPSGRVVAVVVSSGGFIGIGDELSAVPPAALRYASDRHSLVLDASKELLTQAPHFRSDRWPDFSEPVYADGVYRAYRVQPYFTTNTVTEPDNTARNVRDRNDRNPTAFDQGNSEGDVDITARIRRGIVDNKEMSVSARNVKVITRNGQVTLRGPVNTAEEKRIIGDIATGIAVLGNVRNEIEVK